MLDLFTADARHVVVIAHEEAIALGWMHIGSEHLLLGMLGEPQTIAARALARVGIDRDRVHTQLLDHITPGEDRSNRQLPFTPVASEVLNAAKRQSEQRKDNMIDTEHLLLGLASLDEGLAVRIVNELGVTEQQLEAAVAELRADRGPGDQPA